MASELMEQLVMRYFGEVDKELDYSVLGDGHVVVRLPSAAAGTINVVITAQEIPAAGGIFHVATLGITQFPESQTRRALDICNAVSQRRPGKFTVGEDGYVNYCLDWPVSYSAELGDFGLVLALVLDSVEKYYPVFMASRWGNLSVDEALERGRVESMERGKKENPENAAMSDDEIGRLLEDVDLGDN